MCSAVRLRWRGAAPSAATTRDRQRAAQSRARRSPVGRNLSVRPSRQQRQERAVPDHNLGGAREAADQRSPEAQHRHAQVAARKCDRCRRRRGAARAVDSAVECAVEHAVPRAGPPAVACAVACAVARSAVYRSDRSISSSVERRSSRADERREEQLLCVRGCIGGGFSSARVAGRVGQQRIGDEREQPREEVVVLGRSRRNLHAQRRGHGRKREGSRTIGLSSLSTAAHAKWTASRGADVRRRAIGYAPTRAS
eukprot:2104300-Pleurochrysis_carterae.AAC.4